MGHVWAAILAFLGLGTAPVPPPPAPPPPAYVVRLADVRDEKSVFATIQSAYTVPARVRTGGTIVSLKVRQGDYVTRGQVIATVGDPKLGLQSNSYTAQIAAAQAQATQAQADFDRAQRLIVSGAIARNLYDQARTALDVAQSNLKSVRAQAAVVREQAAEGNVAAPTSGRIITVPVTAGTVVMAGDTVATVAERDFVLRLEIPERHARFLKTGDALRLDGSDMGLAAAQFGRISLVYPQVDNGHVVADATIPGMADYFVGQRVRAWVPAGSRRAILVPATLIFTRSGIDYAKAWTARTGALDVPVQRGQTHVMPGQPAMLEILSGLNAGDRLLTP
jgi:RND family efflux transporter MFP subunit